MSHAVATPFTCIDDLTRRAWPQPVPARTNLLLVIGPPGAGKSTLVESLSRSCPLKNAHLDTDHIAYTRPGGVDRSRLELVESNMFHCIQGFRAWGAEYIFCAWITEHQRRLDAVINRFRASNVTARAIVLSAPCHVLIERMCSRHESRFEPGESSLAHLRRLSDRLGRLASCTHIETASRNRIEVLNRVQGLIMSEDYWQD